MDLELKNELSRQGIFTTTLEELYNWGRKSSVWPLQFGLACCAIEMIATTMARYDLARFGAEVFRPSPRQADLMFGAGEVSKKHLQQLSPRLKQPFPARVWKSWQMTVRQASGRFYWMSRMR